MSNLVAFLRWNLFTYRDLWEWIDHPFDVLPLVPKSVQIPLPAPGKHKFRFTNKLLSLDSSTISLCLSLFPWAKFRRTKGAVKLHLLLDHDGYLPTYAYISEGKRNENSDKLTKQACISYHDPVLLFIGIPFNLYKDTVSH